MPASPELGAITDGPPVLVVELLVVAAAAAARLAVAALCPPLLPGPPPPRLPAAALAAVADPAALLLPEWRPLALLAVSGSIFRLFVDDMAILCFKMWDVECATCKAIREQRQQACTVAADGLRSPLRIRSLFHVKLPEICSVTHAMIQLGFTTTF